MYFVSKLRAGMVPNACRTAHGRARPAPAATPHLRKDRLVIMDPLWLTKLRLLYVTCEKLVAFCRVCFSEFRMVSNGVGAQSRGCLR
jgi:hypothetical protein